MNDWQIEDTRQAPEYSENYCDKCENYCDVDDLVTLTPFRKGFGSWTQSVCAECEQQEIYNQWEDWEVKFEEHKGLIEILWTPEEKPE